MDDMPRQGTALTTTSGSEVTEHHGAEETLEGVVRDARG